MNGKALSEALGTLPEDMVAEAMEPVRFKRSFSWLRLAACIAIVVSLFFGFRPSQSEIITAPGILSIQVYAMEENDDLGFTMVELKEGVTWLNEIDWNLGYEMYPGLPIRLSVENDEFPPEEISFEIRVSDGLYFEYGDHTWFRFVKLPQDFTQNNYSTIYWTFAFDEKPLSSADFDQIYTYITIKCEDHIIGYSVLRFDRRKESTLSDTYTPYYVESVFFPKIDGEYQNVTYEYINSKMMVKE